MRIERNVITFGAGASVGVAQTILMKEYVDPNFGPIPWIGGMIPYPWGNWSTLGNILIGGVVFGVSQFTNVVKNSDLKNFLATYGLTTIVGGVMNGVFPGPALRARAGARRLVARAPAVTQAVRSTAAMAPITATGIPPAQILA